MPPTNPTLGKVQHSIIITEHITIWGNVRTSVQKLLGVICQLNTCENDIVLIGTMRSSCNNNDEYQ